MAMTDPQLASNNHNVSCSNNSQSQHNSNDSNINNNNNNHDNGEPKYLHKKFKKMASSEVIVSDGSVLATKNAHPTNIGLEAASFIGEPSESRKSGYVCPYCKLSCAKPSVLQKHIRAHTNERPYPCIPCGFAFKTKSNLYKHCRSRTHALKMEGVDNVKVLQSSLQLSEDSDLSLSDSASNGTGTPPPFPPFLPETLIQSSPTHSPTAFPITGPRPTKIYKPKFHTALQQCTDIEACNQPNTEQVQEHIERIITDNQAIIETLDPRLHKLLHRQQSLVEPVAEANLSTLTRKRCHSESQLDNLFCPNCNITYGSTDNFETHRSFHCKIRSSPQLSPVASPEPYPVLQPLPSPGPLLGTTRLVDTHRPVSKLTYPLDDLIRQRPGALHMFGGEVRIIERDGESKTVRIKPRSGGSPAPASGLNTGPETASIVVRSDLHSGGTMLHKLPTERPTEQPCATLSLTGIKPNISTPNVAPSLTPNLSSSMPCLSYLKPSSILHAGRLIPYVPGMPGPQNLFSVGLPLNLVQPITTTVSETRSTSPGLTNTGVSKSPCNSAVSKFLRPSSLPLKSGTFTPKRHHGITPTANTLPLISPETPRSKKSYGQLYLNGHAYTYLGLKCSTRLFYCTLNRPQPMYVTQQQGISMYSNWKICKEASSEFELALYDSRHRPAGYTLANTYQEGILTHSSQRPSTPSSLDSCLENDGVDKGKRVRIFDGGFESNEDYTYVRGRGRGRYVCEECGIRCKKPSMLKKHIRTHTDVRPYTCGHCAFSFKTKGNLTKHMKSKAHYKKCVELKVLPVPTSVCEENIDKEALAHLAVAGAGPEEESDEEEESEVEVEAEDSEDEGSEEHEAAQSLLSLSRPHYLPGLLPKSRPATYPYALSEALMGSQVEVSPRLSVIRSCRKAEPLTSATLSVAPIDLTISRQHHLQTDATDILLAGVPDPKLLQTIVQTMERLPIQSSEQWSAEVKEGQMLQAYLTERHMMDSKLKQQYRVMTRESEDLVTGLASIAEKTNVVAELPIQTAAGLKTELEQCAALTLQQVAIEKQQSQPQKEKSPLPSRSLTVTMNELVKQQQAVARKVVVGGPEFRSVSPHQAKFSSEFFQSTNTNVVSYISLTDDNRNICSICSKVFSKPSQLRLHINIHYFERPFRCDSCGTSFRTKGHLTKHERSTLHHNKVNMTSTFGAATASNPRPFKCVDCKSAFRIHGHLAKHLRSKMHIMKLECLRKLPFGTYAEMERSGINLNDIDTTDCDTSLTSLQIMAQKLCEKDPTKLGQWEMGMAPNTSVSGGETSSDEGETNPAHSMSQCTEIDVSQNYYVTMCSKSSETKLMNAGVEDARIGPSYKCQMCPRSVRSLSELHVHCFVEHNTESNSSGIHASTSLEEKSEEKDNTHHFKTIDNYTIKQIEPEQKIDAI